MIEKINMVITMGGLGSRFIRAGYTVPKYMIEAKGKSLFEWSMDSLLDYNRVVGKYIFLVRQEDKAVEFITTKCKKYNLPAIEIIELDHLTDGQATTALLGVERLPDDEPIMIYNIDTYVEPYEMKLADISSDGHIPCFHAKGNHWSFVKVDKENRVVEVKEKERISDNCTIGAYYFSSAALYKKLYSEFYSSNIKTINGEKYVAPLYNYMLEKHMHVTISTICADKVHVLGTPEELIRFLDEP